MNEQEKTCNAKLKPCPFCGSRAEIRDGNSSGGSYDIQIDGNGSYTIVSNWKYWKTKTIGCSECSVSKSGEGATGKLALKQAIKIWNMRVK